MPKNNAVQIDTTPLNFVFDLQNQSSLSGSSESLNSFGSSTSDERNTATTPTTTASQSIKRGPGRPKGSKNKPTIDDRGRIVENRVLAHEFHTEFIRYLKV